MKKPFLLGLICISFTITSNAQWTYPNGNAFFNGKVGIGAQIPEKQLSIEGTSSTDIGLSIINRDNNGQILFLNTSNNYIVADQRNAGVLESFNDLIFSAAVNPNNPSPSIRFQTGRSYLEGFTRMTINSIGRVGIGTQSPSKNLSIEGSDISDIGLSIYNSSNQGQILMLSTERNYIVTDQRNAAVIESYNDLIFSAALNPNNPTPSIKFQTGRGSTEGFTRMTIDNIGNVGIGTLEPKYKLDVFGTIRAREIKVDLDGADFVFEEDYELMPLIELEKFVKEQKHLPEVAPAREMEANGTDLGNLNSKLLQKIEELTLYTIAQNKAIEELKQAMTLQSEEIEKLKVSLK